MKKFLVLFIAIFFLQNAFAQDFSNKGKDFYVCFPTHVPSNTASKLSIWITSDKASSGTITMANFGFSATFNIAANGLAEINVPKNANTYITNGESTSGTSLQILKKSIHIQVDPGKPDVVAYAQQYGAARSAATLLLPSNVLGKKYYSISFTQKGTDNGSDLARSQFQVIAIKNNTQVTVTPRKNGVLETPFTIALPFAGDMFQYQSNDAAAATQDLTGTFIESIASGGGDCQPIAVFSGSSTLSIGNPSGGNACTTGGNSFDPLFQQMYPISTWGKNFGLIPFANYPNGVPYRVMASEDNTSIFINGANVATLNKGDIYPAAFTSAPVSVTSPTSISANKPICVAEYEQSAACAGNTGAGANQGDPDMVILNPIEQNISDITIFSTKQEVIRTQWVNVLMKTGGIPSFKISKNGGSLLPPTATWQTFGTSLPGYSYLRQQLPAPGSGTNPLSDSYRLISDSGFNAIAYGQGDFESYAYSAGTNVRDLNQNLEFENQLSIINVNSSCLNSPVRFKIYIPDSVTSTITSITSAIRYDSIKWTLNTPTAFVPNNFPRLFIGDSLYVAPNAGMKVKPDSLRVRVGKPVAWYSIPTNYTITTPGTYTLTVTCYRTSVNDGCTSGNDFDFPFEFIVPPISVPTFDNTIPGCSADTVRFMETTPQTPYPTYHFWWDFGDGSPPYTGNTTAYTTPSFRNPSHKYASPGSYTVRFSNITTPGCVSDTTSKVVVVPQTVTATIAGTTSVCQSTVAGTTLPITFTGDKGLIPYTFTYTPYVNGIAGTPVNVDSDPTLTTKSIQVPITTAGVYRFVLTNVRNANPLFCTVPVSNQEATITVNPLPTATIAGTINVCQNSGNQTVTFTGTGATSPYEFTFIPTINGVAGAAVVVTSNATGIYLLTVPTATPGTYKYDLVSVKVVSTGCNTVNIAGATTTATVFVQANPTGTVSTNISAVCQDGTAPNITFTGSNGAAPYKFTYTLTINGVVGAPIIVQSVGTSNTYTLTVPLNTLGTLIYTLTSIDNTVPITCTTPITGQVATVVINPLPSATISGTTAVCQAAGAQFVTLTGAGGTIPYKLTYTLNGGAPITVFSDPGLNTKVLTVSTAIGTYIYKITKVEDATATVCTQNYVAPNEPTATVVMQATSTATVTPVTTTVCQDAIAPAITFTAANGTAPFTFTYTLTTNGVVSGLLTTTSLTGLFTAPPITVPMGTAGAASTLVYTLLKVKNTGPTTCETTITGQIATVNINPIPTATIATTTTVCQNSTAVPVTFTGANATGGAGASYIFTYTVNNGALQSTAAGNNIVVNQATTVANVFTYRILSVKDAVTNCIKNYTLANAPTTVITVKELATAAITSSVPTVCQNSTTLPAITFTATGGQAPFRFKYTITTNGVLGAVLTSSFTIVGNSITLNAPTGTAGTYIYTLVSVEESANSCVNAQTGSTQVIVHPQPTASFATTPPYCAFNKVTFTPTFGIIPTGSVTSWVWNYGNGTGQQIRIDGADFDITYLTAGIKPVSFKVISDKGCESILFTPLLPVTINSKPKAGFINPEACLADTYAQFSDTSTVAGVGASIVYWSWDFGDLGSPTNLVAGSTLAEKNPQHAYTFVGNKTVKLIVTTNSGCKDTISQSFFINGEVTKANFLKIGTNYCSNRPVTIKEASVVNVGGLIQVDIYWDNVGAPTVFEQDDLPTVGKIYSHNYTNLQTDRTYKVRYIAYSGFNGVCQKDTTIDIVVRASPVAVFAPVQDICLNAAPFVLNPFGNIPPAGSTGVFTGPGVTVSGGVYTFNPLLAGVTTVTNTNIITYAVTSPFTCDSAIKQAFRVLAPPVVSAFTTAGNICIGGPGNVNVVTFNQSSNAGQGGAIVKWIYNWGDGTSQTFTTAASAATVTHSYSTTGITTAHLIVEDAFGCRNAATGKPVTFTVNPLPVVDYNFSTSVCLPNAIVQFNNLTQNLGAHTYMWSFELPSTAAANINTATSPSHTYTTQGPYNTRLIATNILTGCKDSLSKVINSNTIHPKPVLSFGVIPNVCLLNGTVTINQASQTDNTILGGPGIYTCIDVPAAITLVGTEYKFNPLIAGTGVHIIKYFWTSNFGCLDTIKQTVKVLVAPKVDTLYTVGNICEKNKIFFANTTSSSAGNIVSWIYDWGDTNPIPNLETFTDGSNVSHQYALANTTTGYNVKLYVVTNDGCKSLVRTLNVKVNPIPKPDFRFSDTVCLPAGLVKFKNFTQNLNDNMYKWYNDDLPPIIKLGTDNDFTYTNVGPHNVKLIATNATTFCVDSITKVVNTIHPAPTAAFDFSLPSICIGADIRVIDRSTFADGTGNKWDWKWGDNALAQGQTPAPHTYSDANTYNVFLKITNNFGCFDDTTKPFTVYPYPLVDAGRDSAILEGGQIVLTPTVTGNDLRYKWRNKINTSPVYLNNDTILNPIATPPSDITYRLTAIARGGCSASDTVFIKVLKYPIIPNTFSPNRADSRHNYWEIQYLSSYPNNKVQVFTRAGQLVFESRGYREPWDGSNLNGAFLPFDTYYYIIEPGSGRKPITGYVTIVK